MSPIEIFSIVGLLLAIVGWVGALLKVMRFSPGRALLCLFIPFLLPAFVITTWPETKGPVLIWLIGFATLTGSLPFVL